MELATGRLRKLPVVLLKLQKIGQFPDDPVKIEVSQIHYINVKTY
jgi:hypothetical protein